MGKGLRLLLCAVLLAGCSSAARRAPAAWGVEASQHVVAADHPAASAAGAAMLAAGGNVVDAAAATSFALAAARPQSAGLGGGGFMLVKLAGREPVFLDYRETAPLAAEPAAYLGADGLPRPGLTESGPWAVGVPGQLRGLPRALAAWGTLSLAQVLGPAIALAEGGFAVDAHLREAMEDLAERSKSDPARYAEARRIFLKGGEPYALGETLRQPELAAALRRLAEEGAEKFYSGVFADSVLAVAGEAAGGPMTREDLAGYEAQLRRPLAGTYRGRSVLSAPPPSSGGACLLQALGALDGGAAGPAELAEAMKHAFADRARLLGDPDAHPEVEENVRAMLAPRRLRELRRAVRARRASPAGSYGTRTLPDDDGTTHYVVLDAQGNAVSATETVNHYFGSMLVARGLGIVLNNEMDDFAVSTSVANAFGLRQSELNLVGPGRRPLSSMSPTIVLEKGAPVLAAGGSGGPRIITATLQSVVNVLGRGMAPDKAVAAPRLHHQWSPDVLRVEAGVGEADRLELASRGHRLEPARGEAAVQLAVREKGVLRAASDPRKGGKPAGR